MGEESHPALVQTQRDGDNRARSVRVPRQDSAQARLRTSEGARGSSSDSSLWLVPRAGCRSHAELCQHRRIRWLGHDGRHMGDSRVLRADRSGRPSLRRSRNRWCPRTVAGQSGDRGGRCVHRFQVHRRRGHARRRTSCPRSKRDHYRLDENHRRNRQPTRSNTRATCHRARS